MLLALLVKSDAHHARAQRLFEAMEEPVAVPYAVLLEVCWVLQRATKDFAFIAESARLITERFTVVFEESELAGNAVSRYAREFDQFSLVDCELIEWKKTAGFDVVTFDQGLEERLR